MIKDQIFIEHSVSAEKVNDIKNKVYMIRMKSRRIVQTSKSFISSKVIIWNNTEANHVEAKPTPCITQVQNVECIYILNVKEH